jgi:hypothetical protein
MQTRTQSYYEWEIGHGNHDQTTIRAAAMSAMRQQTASQLATGADSGDDEDSVSGRDHYPSFYNLIANFKTKHKSSSAAARVEWV